MRRLIVSVAVAAALAGGVLASAPAAGAAIAPTLTLDQSAGRTAGSMANLGMDLRFSDTGTDSPHNLTINLPPGLLANASIDGGACLKATDTSGTACQVGSGTVVASPDALVLGLPGSISVPVTFYLVPPPRPGDLAGLTVIGNVLGLSEQLGATGDVRVRPTGDPDGVGVTIALALPDQLTLSGVTVPLVTISVSEIRSTFDRLRYPATCPSRPAALTAAVDSYADGTVHQLSAPLSVTGCSALAYAPRFSVTATRDSGDRQVRLGTVITQAAGEAPSRSVSLGFPAATLAPNLASIQALCLNLASGTCEQVGSASATSPLYPATLTGKAYLTGSPSGLALTLVFPAPFPLVLSGAVDLVTNAATFSGLPDIPLTDLAVDLNAGAQGLFLSTCQVPFGTATATLTDQNGDQSTVVPAAFGVAGCPGVSASSAAAGTGTAGVRNAVSVTAGGVTLSRGRLTGVRADRPALSFRLSAARRTPGVRVVTVSLPRGLSFARHGHRLGGVTVRGGAIRSLTVSHGRLTITLRRAVSSLSVLVARAGLREARWLQARARHGTTGALRLTVVARDATGRRVTLSAPLAG